MRAKRSKKYRKIVQQYQLNFGFREPYQVLVDTNFLLAIRAFQMPLNASLERTLHGKVKPFITKCCLEAATARSLQSRKQYSNLDVRPRRPDYLPHPTELPLRHCDHGERGILSETECLLELVSGGAGSSITGEIPAGTGKQPKNKEHYVVATADAEAGEKIAPLPTAGQKRKRNFEEQDMRMFIREVPGVPIIYVKRSVMILEELSPASLGVRRREEKEKMVEGLIGTGQRKRPAIEGDSDEEDDDDADEYRSEQRRRTKRAKAPNPLSVKKPKPRARSGHGELKTGGTNGKGTRDGEEQDGDKPKAKRRRKHSKKSGSEHDSAPAATTTRNVTTEA